ncbi:MAG: hypothetical protein IJH00_03895 [Erysipelotrichaceae bacterium]|nr:hypothetical protein [Erysipelotrichaceae bacterium]
MINYNDLDTYIRENYYEEPPFEGAVFIDDFMCKKDAFYAYEEEKEDLIIELDESFSDTVLKLIDEKGLKDSDVYNSINMDRRLFSKMRNNSYTPSKQTALSLCIALKLDLEQSNDLLRKAGYALSHSNMADVIVEYFIKNKIYDIYTIDEALLHYDQKLLGRY